ncbi:TPA: heavy-metal-associated domain-containing protein, partial [Legionella pneumophila]
MSNFSCSGGIFLQSMWEIMMTAPLTLTTFFVAGLDCQAEEQLIRRQLQAIPEVEKMDFNFIAEE